MVGHGAGLSAGLETPVAVPLRPSTGGGHRLGWALAAAVPLAFLLVFFAWPVVAMAGRGFVVHGENAGAPERALRDRRCPLRRRPPQHGRQPGEDDLDLFLLAHERVGTRLQGAQFRVAAFRGRSYTMKGRPVVGASTLTRGG